MENTAASQAPQPDAGDAAAAAPGKPKRKSEWFKILVFLGVLGAAGFYWRNQLTIGFQLKMIGDENYAQGYKGDLVPLNISAQRSLEGFKPVDLATFLRAPFASWRIVAAQAIAKCKWTKDSPEWNGVAEALAKAATSDAERLARVSASTALLSLPGLSDGDGKKLLAIGEQKGSRDGRAAVLQVVSKNCPELKDGVRTMLLKMGDEGAKDEKQAALAAWTKEFGKDREPPSRWLLALAKDGGDLAELIEPAQTVVRGNAAGVAKLISAGKHGATAVVLGSFTGRGRPAAVEKPEQLEEASVGLLGEADIEVSRAGLRCLLGAVPNGWNVFAKHLAAATPETRTKLLSAVAELQLAPRDGFTFGREEGDLVASWISESAGDWENPGARLFRLHLAPGRGKPLFAPESGINNPANAKHVENLLSSQRPDDRWLAGQYFSGVNTLTEPKLPQIESVVKQELAQPLKWEERDESLARSRKLVEDLIKRFPARAELKAILAEVAQGEERRKKDPPPPIRPRAAMPGGS